MVDAKVIGCYAEYVGPISCPKTSAKNYQHLLLKNPKSEDLVYTLPKKKKPLLQNFVFL
jgi:hypothetical protein